MKPLYEIANEYHRFLQQIMESEELSDDQIQELNQFEGDIKDKVINVAAFIKNLEAESEAIDQAIENMETRKKRLDKKAQNLRDYLKMHMEVLEVKEVKSPYFDVKVRQNPSSVNIYNEAELPDKYKKEVILRRADKLMILDELKHNVLIPGAALEQRSRLDIR